VSPISRIERGDKGRQAKAYRTFRPRKFGAAQNVLDNAANRNHEAEVPEMSETTKRFSRRKFTQLLGAGATYAVAQRGVSWGKRWRTADTRRHFTSAPAGVVRLSANENPYGPSPMALKAMTDAFSISCRYPDEHADALIEALASLNGVERNQILLGNGSGEILKLCAAAFTGSLEPGNNRPVELLPRSRVNLPQRGTLADLQNGDVIFPGHLDSPQSDPGPTAPF